MKIRLFILACLMTVSAFAQNTVSADFDGDGAADQAHLITADGGFTLTTTLTSQPKKPVSTSLITVGGQQNKLAVSKNVLLLTCQFMRGMLTYRFRYDPALTQMKLIGYDNEQFGTATNEGAGKASYNLLTGVYEAQWNYFFKPKRTLIKLPKLTKKYPVENYLLADFNDNVIEKISQLDYSSLPKVLR